MSANDEWLLQRHTKKRAGESSDAKLTQSVLLAAQAGAAISESDIQKMKDRAEHNVMFNYIKAAEVNMLVSFVVSASSIL